MRSAAPLLCGSVKSLADQRHPPEVLVFSVKSLLRWSWPRALLLVLLICGLPAQALQRERSLAQAHHTRWTSKDGAPLGIRKMAQTSDGWLWLGSTSGLFRFDGVRFERFAPPEDPGFGARRVSTLAAGRNGELWVGLLDGGMARIDAAGTLTVFKMPAGLAPGGVLALAAGPDGEVWAGLRSELLRFDGREWARVGTDWNLPLKRLGGVHLDLNGALWVSNDEQWYRLDRGSLAFVPSGMKATGGRSVRILSGASWMLTADSLLRLPGSEAQGQVLEQPRDSSSMFVDRANNLWNMFCPAGLCRGRLPGQLPGNAVALPPVDDSFTSREGLSGDIGMTVLEDRESNLWVATQTGLDRFRDTAMVRLDLPRTATSFAVVPAADDEMLIAALDSQGSLLWRVKNGQREALVWPSAAGRLQTVHRDAQGQVWLGGANGVWRLDGERSKRVTPEGPAGSFDSRRILSDARGLWVLFRREGLRLLADEEWRAPPLQGLDSGREMPTTFELASDGSVWAGYRDNRLVQARPDGTRSYGPEQGIAVGAVSFIHAGRRLLIAGELGVQMLVDGRFHALLSSADAEALRGVTGAAQTRQGELWLNTVRGAVRISAAELQRFEAAPSRTELKLQVFDALDGYPASAAPQGPQSSLAQGPDGRLWFAGIDGVAWLDPAALPAPVSPPRVLLQALAADQVWRPAREPLELPPGTQSVALRFTAQTLAMPERVQFQARLDGIDKDWRELGGQREISYNNLGPGAYRLQLRAMGAEDKPDGNPPTQLSFAIQPQLVQTWWFKTLAALLGVGLAAGLLQLRAQRAAARQNEKLHERMAERERIARELHDTLLQGVHGLTLRFQKVANRMAAQDPNRALMEAELERADRLIIEGRDRVLELRSPGLPRLDLGAALANLGEQLAAEQDVQFGISIQGRARALIPAVQDELLQIGQEALHNAFRHARARAIRVELRYSWHGLRLSVRDDGVGMAPHLSAQGRPGHFGLTGMRERARDLSALLRLHSAPGQGTTIELWLLALGAYARPGARQPGDESHG